MGGLGPPRGIGPSRQLTWVAKCFGEPNYSPHPADIMALHALYQRR